MRSNLTTPVTSPDPGLTAAKLYKRVITARRQAEDADRAATIAATEAAAAKVNLDTLEAEYKALSLGHAA